ncbi:MAG: nucleoside phosphorylase [Crocinitomicaceae bacterium]|nr:nucleoside phosphorylase [Crocinitomicaceae bacterium]MDP5099513.1 nucleoside phosphorylase [Crocinitomicaceae bacterium]
MQYPETELVLNKNGQVYHLGLSPENVSDKIILVGDQDRVDLVASFFDTIEHSSQHREFVSKTGTYKGKRITALSTGIGTDNIDITISELDALVNIDLINRCDKESKTGLSIIRIGTCGILQPEVPIHSYILSSHAYGLDNVAHFYEIEKSYEETELNKAISAHLNLPSEINTYTVSASDQLVAALASDKTVKGITVTSSGFYGPQGRQLRLKTKTEELNDQLTSFQHELGRIINFEMESSALFALGKALGHDCATICLGIANRPTKDFSKDYSKDMLKLIEYVLDRI